ncbi:unnamed protein product [Jaminaea pallidilutea]
MILIRLGHGQAITAPFGTLQLVAEACMCGEAPEISNSIDTWGIWPAEAAALIPHFALINLIEILVP